VTGPPVLASANGISLAVSAAAKPGDLLLVVVGGEGMGLLHYGGPALHTLINVTYSECGSHVIASSGIFAAELSPGVEHLTFSGTTYHTNKGATIGAVAYTLAPVIRRS
jgi:hypothetical protein